MKLIIVHIKLVSQYKVTHIPRDKSKWILSVADRGWSHQRKVNRKWLWLMRSCRLSHNFVAISWIDASAQYVCNQSIVRVWMLYACLSFDAAFWNYLLLINVPALAEMFFGNITPSKYSDRFSQFSWAGRQDLGLTQHPGYRKDGYK